MEKFLRSGLYDKEKRIMEATECNLLSKWRTFQTCSDTAITRLKKKNVECIL